MSQAGQNGTVTLHFDPRPRNWKLPSRNCIGDSQFRHCFCAEYRCSKSSLMDWAIRSWHFLCTATLARDGFPNAFRRNRLWPTPEASAPAATAKAFTTVWRAAPSAAFASHKCNSSLKAYTGERELVPSLRTGSCRVRSQRCTVRTPRLNSEAISFQLCTTAREVESTFSPTAALSSSAF